MAKLVLSQEGVITKEFPLDKEQLSIGRKPHNDVQIDDITVSGQHAVVSVEKNFYLETLKDIYIEDQNSTNGTFVNGKKIKKHMLRHGDVVQIGRHEFKFLDEDAPDFDQTVVLQQQETKKAESGLLPGYIKVLNGPKAGKTLDLVKSYTSMGNAGTMVVIAKRPQGYFASHVTGKSTQEKYPLVNGNPIGSQSVPLQDHDVIEIGGLRLEFALKSD
jgi:pSer/pThr/pTyr-binding forkhead associated (FHA) protein